MRLFHLIVIAPVAIVAAAFAVSNLDRVGYQLWPLPYVLEAPLFLGVFAGFLLGFLGGAVVMWNSGRRWRRLARNRDDELRRAARAVSTLKEQESRRAAETKTESAASGAPVSGALAAPDAG